MVQDKLKSFKVHLSTKLHVDVSSVKCQNVKFVSWAWPSAGQSLSKCFAGLLPKLMCSSISLLCSMNCQTLFLPDTDILLQPKVSNRDHAGYKEGDHVDLYIHRRPAIGGDRVSTVLSRRVRFISHPSPLLIFSRFNCLCSGSTAQLFV
jgi:hypothetical protein